MLNGAKQVFHLKLSQYFNCLSEIIQLLGNAVTAKKMIIRIFNYDFMSSFKDRFIYAGVENLE